MLESKFQKHLIDRIHDMLPNALVLKNDANYIQGIPDLLILNNKKWAMLEVKNKSTASHQPNQDYYVSLADKMSFGAFIYPENEEEVLGAMAKSLGSRR